MDVQLSPADEAFRGEIRAFLDASLTDGLRDAARTDQWLLSHDPELHVDGTGSAAQPILAQLDANHQTTPGRAAGFDGVRLQRR